MLSRQYSRKIILKEATAVADGFGGFVPQDVVLASVWAEVKQKSAFKDAKIVTNRNNSSSYSQEETPNC